MAFRANRFETLLEFLEAALARPSFAHTARARLELDKARPFFVGLLDRKGRDAREEEMLKKGEFVYDGKTHTVNADFIQEALFLSSQLHLSELHSALLLHHSIPLKSRFQRTDADTAAILYHRERAALLKCLHLVFTDHPSLSGAGEDGEEEEGEDEEGMRGVLEGFRRELVDADVVIGSGAGGKGKWVDKLIKELDATKSSIAALKQQLLGGAPAAAPSFGARLGGAFGASTSAMGAGNPPPTSATAKFSDDVVLHMLEATQRQRRDLAQLVYAISRARLLAKPQITTLITMLAESEPTDPILVHLLVSLLSAWECESEGMGEEGMGYLDGLCQDRGFLVSMTEFVGKKKWRVKQVRAVAMLQWGMFMEAAYQQEPDLEPQLKIWYDEVESMILTGIANDAFPFLAYDVLSFQQPHDIPYRRILTPPRTEDASRTLTKDELLGVEEDFHPAVLNQLQTLTSTFVASQQSLLRKLRNREEDALGAFHGSLMYKSMAPGEGGPTPPRRDVEDLFALVAAVYRGRSDGGLVFWGEPETTSGEEAGGMQLDSPGTGGTLLARTSYFLRWAAECRSNEIVPSVYELLAALATGRRSADKAYEFFVASAAESDTNPSPCSWVYLFRCLHHYVGVLAQVDAKSQEIDPEEVRHMRAYVRLLKQVVKASPSARMALYNHQKYKPLNALFNLVVQPIALEFKAELLSTLAAFAAPGDSTSAEIAQKCWLHLEGSQILSTVSTVSNGGGGGGGAGGGMYGSGLLTSGPLARTGILAELEEVEVPGRMFPQSTAFVSLLAALVHPAKRTSPLRSGAELELQSIPENLGGSHRPPGIDPYIRFVVEEMLQKAASRDYLHSSDVFRVFETCLTFVERCLAAYDLGPLLASGALGGPGQQTVATAVQRTISHPGFDIMLRVLSNSELTRQLLETVASGPQHLEHSVSSKDHASRCVLRALRILNRVAMLQGPFLEVVMPLIAEHGNGFYTDRQLEMMRCAESLDQHIFHSNAVVVAAAVLVGCQVDDEIALLAVQLVQFVSESQFFNAVDHRQHGKSSRGMNRLLALIEGSEDSEIIVDAFLGRIDTAAYSFTEPDGDEFVLDATDELDDRDMAKFNPQIRAAILELLLLNTQTTRSGPNIAHLLLGFDIHVPVDRLVIENQDSRKARAGSLYTILDLLDLQTADEQDAEDVPQVSLLERDALLTEQCQRLIRQLCIHDYSSAAMSRFLRTSKEYFVRQAQTLPMQIPERDAGGAGILMFRDGQRLRTSSAMIVAALHATAWLLECVALELSALTQKGMRDATTELVTVLFDNGPQARTLGMLEQSGRPEQMLPRMQEILLSLNFDWQDDLPSDLGNLKFFGGINVNSCLLQDSTGCEVFDTTAVLNLLGACRREAQARGLLVSATQQQELKQEVRSYIQAVVAENHRREVAFARAHATRAWRSVLDLTLCRAFAFLPAENRHIFLLDLLSAILPQIASGDVENETAELFSQVVVSLVTKLRYEAKHLDILSPGEAVQAFPVDRLLPTLESVLQGILRSNGSAIVRGNLYTSLLNFLHYAQATSSSIDGDNILSAFKDRAASDGASTMMSTQRSPLESGSLDKLKSVLDRLLPEICRDATVGLEVWKTVAFTVLDAILTTADRSRYGAKVLAVLERDGSLKRFVDLLKESENALLNVLEPDPTSLNALYVYEAQTTFLTRIASTRSGAEKLLEFGVLENLGKCSYLRAAPRNSSSMMEFDTFMPSTTERHHQLLLPALQLVTAVLLAVGAETPAAAQCAHGFVMARRQTILETLADQEILTTTVGIQEVHLITVLVRIAMQRVGDDEMASPNGFGTVHASLMAIAAKVCGGHEWAMAVIPLTDAEREDDSVREQGSSLSVFGMRTREWALSLQASLLTYLRISSRRHASKAFQPVLLPTLRLHNKTTAGTSPSFGSTFNLLRETTESLTVTLLDCGSLAAKAQNWTGMNTEDLDEFVPVDARSEFIGDSDRRFKARHGITKAYTKAQSRAITLLNILETALLLLWRNASHYFNAELEAVSRTMGGREGRLDPSLREDCLSALRPLTNRLQMMKLSQAGFSEDEVRERQSYLQSLVRNLADLFSDVRS